MILLDVMAPVADEYGIEVSVVLLHPERRLRTDDRAGARVQEQFRNARLFQPVADLLDCLDIARGLARDRQFVGPDIDRQSAMNGVRIRR